MDSLLTPVFLRSGADFQETSLFYDAVLPSEAIVDSTPNLSLK